MIPYTAEQYESVFHKHLTNLDKFAAHSATQGILPKLLTTLHDNGWCVCYLHPLFIVIHRCILMPVFLLRLTLSKMLPLPTRFLQVHLMLLLMCSMAVTWRVIRRWRKISKLPVQIL